MTMQEDNQQQLLSEPFIMDWTVSDSDLSEKVIRQGVIRSFVLELHSKSITAQARDVLCTVAERDDARLRTTYELKWQPAESVYGTSIRPTITDKYGTMLTHVNLESLKPEDADPHIGFETWADSPIGTISDLYEWIGNDKETGYAIFSIEKRRSNYTNVI
jgi:hypothetical protein